MTWSAERVADGRPVVIKQTLRPAVPSPAALDRRASLLQISHPRLAACVEFLETAGSTPSSWRVQERTEGTDLQTGFATWRYTEDEILRLAEEVGEALEYLHDLSPPLVHGDLKPINVIQTLHGAVLVDFGEPGDPPAPGFAPPEQLRGSAAPRSDLYALGAVAVTLLTREAPSRLSGPDGRLRWRGKARVRQATRSLIDALIDPEPRERPASARAVREQIRSILDGEWATVPVRQMGAFEASERAPSAGWLAVGALAVLGMHATVATLFTATALATARLALATEWPTRIGLAWLAALPLTQWAYVGPILGITWRAHRPLAQGMGIGAGLTVLLYLAGLLAELVSAR